MKNLSILIFLIFLSNTSAQVGEAINNETIYVDGEVNPDSDLGWWSNELRKNERMLSEMKKRKKIASKLKVKLGELDEETRDFFQEKNEYEEIVGSYNELVKCHESKNKNCLKNTKKRKLHQIDPEVVPEEKREAFVFARNSTLVNQNPFFNHFKKPILACFKFEQAAGTIGANHDVAIDLSLLGGKPNRFYVEPVGSKYLNKCLVSIIEQLPYDLLKIKGNKLRLKISYMSPSFLEIY